MGRTPRSRVRATACRRSRRRGRRGGSTTGLLITLGLIGTFATVTIVVTPRIIQAGPGGPGQQLPADPERASALRQLAELIGHSHGVLAVHERGRSPFVEVLLWLEDGSNPGVIDRDEIALLTHSEIMGTVVFRAFTPPEDLEHGLGPPAIALPAVVTWADVSTSAFCEQWRRSRHVEPRVLLAGISDLLLTWRGEGLGGTRRLRIGLIWSSETSDAEVEEAWLEVDVLPRDPTVED